MMLDEDKLERLEALLTDTNRYSVETVDGLFSAAIVGPGNATLDDCIALLEIGGAQPWASERDEAEAHKLLEALWKMIAWRVGADPIDLADEALPLVDMPIEFEELDDVSTYKGDFPLASDWAIGFRFGINEWTGAWSEWLDDDVSTFFGIVTTLSSDQAPAGGDEDGAKPPTFTERLQLLNAIPHYLSTFHRRRLGEAHPGTVRHAQGKTGRNDLCPCGSGKKYKKCCGA
ncbi:uncharacterized protein YecA (UPF0149 family) [Luteibacter rhizovicinus]|uniref:Uncharacterized protein YecA (UPF0149 family) n=1 Tax=Luteibacter rhizovicinus TaxID=242606 RepID=A0A4R3YTD1_9GAMM|nr:UPF0149 family protein [Luteibacter rhizovicinus]TCV96187.1 uncharacterized protein YecA (UPF0149 family) [Luteibacter rhizovicinus]